MSIILKDFSFAYSDQDIFEHVSIEFSSKAIILLYGENGSGKTTFCRLIMGLQKGIRGSLLFNNLDLAESNTDDIAKKITYLKQNAELNILAATPQADLDIWYGKFESRIQAKKSSDVFNWFGLENIKDQPVWELSGGQLQRLALSSLLLNQSKYWLLDEPVAGLDHTQINKLLELLEIHRKQNGTLIISHRYPVFADIADQIYSIKKLFY